MTADRFDDAVLRAGLDWLAQYARFQRKSPSTLAPLAESPDDFELVPVPKDLLVGLARSRGRLAVPDLSDPALVQIRRPLRGQLRAAASPAPVSPRGPDGLVAALRRWRGSPAVFAPALAVERLTAALEGGDVNAAMRLVSPRYLDADGRGSDHLRAALARLLAETILRRATVVRLVETARGADEVSLSTEIAWEATLEGDPPERVVERLLLELHFTRDLDGVWRISWLGSR